ncbi:hypothetical protein [Novosphingobium aquimarinum]|uniref:hypothetical protein n=1 Tax=Novosphingobium aquimarinum TaxID=2682494 RepID=UPI0012ECA171|nr:hypothetical protein [Novosphingobium aquimarinum]
MAFALFCAFISQVPDLVLLRASPNLDFWVHYNYAREYVAAIGAGEWRPHWAFQAHEGLGEPGLMYYAPLYYYAVWALHLLTGSVWQAMQWVEIGAGALLGWFTWRLCADWGYGRLSLLAVPLAVFAPNLVLLHNGFNGYPWASAGGPLAVLYWALMRPKAFDGRVVDPVAIGALSLVICTHTVTGLMAVIMIGATGLPVVLRAPVACWRSSAVWRPAATILGGLALSAWYLLPAFGSLSLIEAGVWRENYTPYDAFSLPVLSAAAHGIRWFGFQWPISLVSFALCGTGLWIVWRKKEASTLPPWFAPTLAIVAVTIFLSTELSYPLWMIDTPLRNVQFPHRFVTLLEPVAPFLLVCAWARIGRWRSSSSLVLGLTAIASLTMGAALVAKSALVDGESLTPHLGTLSPYPGLDEYRTAAAAERGYRSDDFDWPAHCAARNLTCSRIGRSGGAIRFRVDATDAGPVTLPIFQFPSWAVEIGGVAVPVRAERLTGLAEVELPAGRSEIAMFWKPLPLETAGIWTTLAALLLLVTVAIGHRMKRSAARPIARSERSPGPLQTST